MTVTKEMRRQIYDHVMEDERTIIPCTDSLELHAGRILACFTKLAEEAGEASPEDVADLQKELSEEQDLNAKLEEENSRLTEEVDELKCQVIRLERQLKEDDSDSTED